MIKYIIKKFKNKNIEKEIFNTWKENIDYINSIKESRVVVTNINHEKSLFILIYLNSKIFFLEKNLNESFISVSGIAHENMIKNPKLWECIKFSKSSGNIMDTSSLMLYISSILEKNKENLNISYSEERDMWFDICMFIDSMKTVPVNLPKYKEGENIWVD